MSNICPSFVQHLSKICKCPSFVKFFTNKWTIVNFLSNICPYFVQFLQFVQMFKHQRKIGQSYCQMFVQVLSKNKFLLWLQNVSIICPKFVFDQGLSNLMSNDLGNHTNFCECPNFVQYLSMPKVCPICYDPPNVGAPYLVNYKIFLYNVQELIILGSIMTIK